MATLGWQFTQNVYYAFLGYFDAKDYVQGSFLYVPFSLFQAQQWSQMGDGFFWIPSRNVVNFYRSNCRGSSENINSVVTIPIHNCNVQT